MLQNEMMMRPTISPKELQDVKRYETMQKMIRNKNSRQRPAEVINFSKREYNNGDATPRKLK